MRIPIRPGKVTCAGIVVIFMVLPNSIWKGADARDAPAPKPTIESVKKQSDSSSLDRPHDDVAVNVGVRRDARDFIEPFR
jgi:hypothetical protein